MGTGIGKGGENRALIVGYSATRLFASVFGSWDLSLRLRIYPDDDL